jgi:hypothetical protein
VQNRGRKMQMIAMQKIHFTTRSTLTNEPGYLGLQSRTGRFACLESLTLYIPSCL